MCNIVHVYVNYANWLKGLQFPTPTLFLFPPVIILITFVSVIEIFNELREINSREIPIPYQGRILGGGGGGVGSVGPFSFRKKEIAGKQLRNIQHKYSVYAFRYVSECTSEHLKIQNVPGRNADLGFPLPRKHEIP